MSYVPIWNTQNTERAVCHWNQEEEKGALSSADDVLKPVSIM